jgi:hypothetical protein
MSLVMDTLIGFRLNTSLSIHASNSRCHVKGIITLSGAEYGQLLHIKDSVVFNSLNYDYEELDGLTISVLRRAITEV